MVIQSNMSPKAITEVWQNSNKVFITYNVPISEQVLETLVETNILISLLKDLNNIVGSLSLTYITSRLRLLFF